MARKDDVSSPDGMKVVASAGGEGREEEESLNEALHDEIRALPASGEMKDFACGHCGVSLYHMDLYGLVLHSNGKSPEKCGQCAAEWFRSISCRCALCGLPIMPGDPVALYGPSNKFKRQRVTEVRSGVLGCMRWDCCPSGGFFAGHWTGKGFRPAFPDGQTVVERVFATGQTVVGDLSQKPEGESVIELPLPPDLARAFRAPWYKRLWDKLLGR
jgi:hypothetical protein